MSNRRPADDEYAPAFGRYVSLVPEDDILSAIEQQSSETQKLIASLDETRAAHRYAEGKWSVKQILGHLTDAERIFGYRALAIARGDQQSLPGFEENDYVVHGGFDAWRVGDFGEMYALSRRANIVFFRNLPEGAWDRRGIANQNEATVRGIAYALLGHERHHLSVLREKYGLG